MGIDNAKGIRIKQMTEYIASSGDQSLVVLALFSFMLHTVLKNSKIENVQGRLITINIMPEKIQIIYLLIG